MYYILDCVDVIPPPPKKGLKLHFYIDLQNAKANEIFKVYEIKFGKNLQSNIIF